METVNRPGTRPAGITALSVFFLAGALASLTAVVSLLFPGTFLDPLWRVNPRAHEGFAKAGAWAVLLMCTVSAACAAAAVGLWRGARWGYRLAIILFALNMLGDILNAALGIEPWALIGVPIAAGILLFLRSGRVRRFFGGASSD